MILDAGGRVVRVEESVGNAAIPPDGSVLSGAGTAATGFLRTLTVGSLVTVSPMLPASCAAEDVVGAGPSLVADGRVSVSEEGFGHENVRLPRTAFALTNRGTWLLVSVDGRNPATQGLRLGEFAAELVALGATRAVNLDGGDASTLVVNDVVRNSPAAGEREVGDALLLFSVHDLAALRLVMDRVAVDPGQIDAAAIEPLYQRYDNAVAAFAAEELDRVRLEVEALRNEVKQRAGGEITRAAARVLEQAADAYLRILPKIQQTLNRQKSIRE